MTRMPKPAEAAAAPRLPAPILPDPGPPEPARSPADQPPRPGSVGGLRIALATACNRRPGNEDAVGVGGWLVHGEPTAPLELLVRSAPGRMAMVALADGLGGPPAGEIAAAIAAVRLSRPAPRDQAHGTTEALLHDLFRAADGEIRAAATAQTSGMGCTAAVVAIGSDGRALVGNVGDVRVYRVVDGYAAQVTLDDRSDEAADRIDQCLGGWTATELDPHFYAMSVLPDDRLILCSDGLYDALPPAEIMSRAEAARGWRASAALAADLVNAALYARRGDNLGDNVTVAILDVAGTRRPPAMAPGFPPPGTAGAPGGTGLRPGPGPADLPDLVRPSWLRRTFGRGH